MARGLGICSFVRSFVRSFVLSFVLHELFFCPIRALGLVLPFFPQPSLPGRTFYFLYCYFLFHVALPFYDYFLLLV
jgi:hypothetical protein